jgi:hypothetical protein
MLSCIFLSVIRFRQVPIVVKAVGEVARTKHISPKKIWQHLRRWSEMLQATRKVWA